MNRIITSFLLILHFSVLFAQEVNEQIEISVENDKLVAVDRYYTSGLFISYKKSISQDFLFKKDSSNRLQLDVLLGNETYTPTNLSDTNTRLFDRPFAGWLFLKFKLGTIKRKAAFFISIETGITGKASQAGNLQKSFHNFLNINDNPTWEQEIAFKVLVNAKAKYILSRNINEHNNIQYYSELSLGTKDVYFNAGVDYYFGRFNTLQNSARINSIDKTSSNEFFGFLGLGYKYVGHNTLIQGGLNYEDELFTSKIERQLLICKAGVVFKIKKNTFKFVLQSNSKETPNCTSHAYGSFKFSRDI